jgi:hypothetical protein
MKNLLVVCLILTFATLGSAQAPTPESFMPAEQFGDPEARSFFRWSTSVGVYILRHDGFGEFTSPERVRRLVLVRIVKGRFERIYYLEHESDLFLLCKIRGHGFYLVRMEQKRTADKPGLPSLKPTKIRWFTPLGNLSGEDPSMDGDVIRVGKTIEVSKASGRILKQD